MNILKQIVGSQARTTLFEFFTHNETKEIQFGDLQKLLSINPRQLTIQLQKLKEIDFIKERSVGNRKYYVANIGVRYFTALKQLVSAMLDDGIWRWERAATIHHLYITAEAAMKPMKKYFGVCWPTVLMSYTGENVVWSCKDAELVSVGQHIVDWYRRDNNSHQFEKDVQIRTFKLQSVIQEIEKVNALKLSDEALLNLYNKARESYVDWYALLWSAEPVSSAIQLILNDKLKDISPDKAAQLTVLTRKAPSQKIEDAFDVLTQLARKKNGNFKDAVLQKAVVEFQKRYFWIYNNYFETKILQEEEIILDVKRRLQKSEFSLVQKDNIAKTKVALIKELKLDKETIEILEVSSDFIYWQDVRKKWIMIFAHYLDLLLKEIGKRANVSIRDMRYTLPQELRNILIMKKRIDFQERRKNCFIVVNTGEVHGVLYSGDKATGEEKKYLLAPLFYTEVEVLRGTSACSGKAIGIARIIMNPAESYKVNHGDVLVTSMTSPDFMQAIRKCVGIVTNEGGITCHAAVLAREFNIPCIIGTKTATKVIKDGDRIEVDADKGIVRKL